MPSPYESPRSPSDGGVASRAWRTAVRHSLAAAAFATLLALGGCPASMHPFHECEPNTSRCEGSMAVNCVHEAGNPFAERYVYARNRCDAPLRCAVVSSEARCFASDAICHPSTAERRCLGDIVVGCRAVGDPNDDVGREVPVTTCTYGNVCLEGDCIAPGDVTCDPATSDPACRDERPTICHALEGPRVGGHRLAYADGPCDQGNRCLDTDAFAACGVAATPCRMQTFRDRCEADGLVTCASSYPKRGRGWTGVERRQDCPHGCIVGSGGAACANGPR